MSIENQTIADKYIYLEILHTRYRLRSYVSHRDFNNGRSVPIETLLVKENHSIGTAIEVHLDRLLSYTRAGYVLIDVLPKSPPTNLNTHSARITSSASATWAYAV